MAILYDLITASNLAGYYEAQNPSVALGDRYFPARQQLGLQLSHVKGGSGAPVVLKPSAFDARAVLRGRQPISIGTSDMPFFKEAMLVKEQDRQQLNMVSASGNTELVDMLVNNIFNDQLTLLNAARTRIEAMRMELLATGSIRVEDNGIVKDVDYGVPEENIVDVDTAWGEAGADPLGDLETAIMAMEEQGIVPAVAFMNPATFTKVRQAVAAEAGTRVGRSETLDIIADDFGLRVELKTGSFVNDNGEMTKFFPDDVITLAPDTSLGNTVFGTTPEESDLATGQSEAQVSVVESGIAVTTQQLVDPVNVQTKVSFIGLPSFELADSVYILNIGTPTV